MPAILVYGPSGGGKTTAIRPPEGPKLPAPETFIISPDSKPLPFLNWKADFKFDESDFTKSNYQATKDPFIILNTLKLIEEQRDDINYVILDSITHVMIKMFMDEAHRKDWDKWTEFAKQTYDILNFIQSMTKNVVVIGHDSDENDAYGKRSNKMRTLGKFLDEKVEIPSMFTYVFVPFVKRHGTDVTYLFRTQSDGINAAKSPYGIFKYEIPNNYKMIFDQIQKHSIGIPATKPAEKVSP